MFHVGNHLYFGRLPDGKVRVIQFNSQPNLYPSVGGVYSSIFTDFDFVVSENTWPSIVAAVSRLGEAGGRFYKAQAFHMNEGSTP